MPVTVHKGSDQITCNIVSGAIGYNYRVLRPGEDPEVVGPQNQIVEQAGVLCQAADLFAGLSAADYDVYVRAKDAAGDWGPYSAPLTVTLVLGPAAPENVRVV